jgi:hypothetical protein
MKKEMKSLRSQVSSIVDFENANTLDAINKRYNEIEAEIKRGVNRLAASPLWGIKEADEIEGYAYDLLEMRRNEARTRVIKAERMNWTF